jgi:acyl-CoA oxidase
VTAPQERAAGRTRRVREAAEALGVRAVLLAYWGTTSLLARCRTNVRTGVGESVRRKA